MRVLLVGNYLSNRQPSMLRFAELIQRGLEAVGHEVRLVRPPVILGRINPGETGLAKWIGYGDRFLLFPPLLRRQVRWADVVHICDQANAVYIPHLGGKPHVVTCHDVLAIRAALGEIPESPTCWSGRIYQRWILRNLQKAKWVVCVSRHTLEDVRRIAGVREEGVRVIHNALNYPYRPMRKEQALPLVRNLGVKLPFCLHVGGNEWYKNRPGVLRIFAELVKCPGYEQHRLVMAGKPCPAELYRLIGRLGCKDRVIKLIDVTNEELRALYSTAEVLLFPSLHEGFGWPIIEAQACGCPVVTTNRPPMTEVGGEGAAIYIDPTVPEDAATAVARGLAERERLRREGLRNATRYSQDAMIGGYLAVYQMAMREQRDVCAAPRRRK